VVQNKKPLKVAIVHDWLVGGGAELVVEQLHKIYPDAPIYTSYATSYWRQRLDNKVVTGYLGLGFFGRLRKFLPLLRILWFENLDLRKYDLIVSSSGAEAKGVKKLKPGALHVNYCHAPTHYYWRRYDEYLKNPGFGGFNFLARAGLKVLISPLRKWDYKAAQRPDVIITNSHYIKQAVKIYYDRESTVLHPPVGVDRFTKNDGSNKSETFIVVGRQTPYKHLEVAVKACSKLNLPLEVYGDGPEHLKLRKLAGPSVSFYQNADDEQVTEALQRAKAFIFTSEDDFGIAPVEALAAGTPVIAYGRGGAKDYIIPGKTGLFFNKQTSQSLIKALHEFKATKFNKSDLTAMANTFAPEVFRDKIIGLINQKINERTS
jgi:glycosyltransferase involved in cell wall biosynthesis